jgi:hypothetical protein
MYINANKKGVEIRKKRKSERKICKQKELKKHLSLYIEDTHTEEKGILFIANK